MAKSLTAGMWLRRLAAVLAIALLVVVAGGYVFLARQGAPATAWEKFPDAKVSFDTMGIPTIEAADWAAVLRTEGYVVASERLWQMDLIRRKAGGRLAEWFGAAAFDLDVKNRSEDRDALVHRDAELLPAAERQACEQFAVGVNRFITEGRGRWGAEYGLLRVEPEPWTCSDSLLVILEMSETLTAAAEGEARNYAWRRHLSPAWQRLIFPDQHPWNAPLFGFSNGKPTALPPPAEWIAKRPLEGSEGGTGDTGSPNLGDKRGDKTGSVVFEDPPVIGSNNWAWSGRSGVYVANDPHLGYGVPDIWYALRLKVGKDDWVVGVTIPGLPGIVLGMNPHVAWGFTNTGEDVDDFLKETLRNGGSEYLAKGDQATGEWRPVIKKSLQIKVKGEAAPREVEALFTHRGPMSKRRYLGDDMYSRQWLPLKDGILRLPTLQIMRAKNLDEVDRAIDDMRTPAQNVVAADRAGNLSYRTSGTGVDRPTSGIVPQDAVLGEWRGLKDYSSRPKLRIARDSFPKFIATANQRIWRDELGHTWSSDDRVETIRTALAANPNQTRADMEALQKNVGSRFRRDLVTWVARNAGPQSDPKLGKILASWRNFAGTSEKDERVFTHTDLMEDELSAILLGRVRDAFLTGDDRAVKYESWMRRAWVLSVLMAGGDDGVAPFGLNAHDLAQHLLAKVAAEDATLALHSETNRWRGQHPFVGRVPLFGALFKIDEFPQMGSGDTPRAERPRFGPSMRLVWDLSRPAESTWSFPVGQSGHAWNAHYHDFQPLWRVGKSIPVFPPEVASEFQF